MTIKVDFKTGDTFLLQCVVKIDNVVQDITDWTIACSVKQGSTFLDSCTITKLDAANGLYQIKKQDTTAWPAKTLLCDVQYTLPSSQIISTETFEIACVAGITP